MAKFWSYIATILTGVVAGLLIFLRLKDPDQVINDNTCIGKMKQRGEGNNADIAIDQDPINCPSRREIRKLGRMERKRERKAKSESG